jgi:hypothetical protein
MTLIYTFRKIISPFILILFSLTITAQTVDFHQARNNFQNTLNVDWVGGILNATHTDYYEGQGVPQRVIFTGLSSGSHTFTMKVLAQKGSAHAYDFLISWWQAYQTGADIGGSVNELASLFSNQWASAISSDAATATSNGAFLLRDSATIPDLMGAPSIGGDVNGQISTFETRYTDRKIHIWANAPVTAGTFTITFDGYDADYAFYTIGWNSAASDVAVLFAGHAAIGTSGYGTGKGAGSISGGPYHFKLLTLDATQLGQQDNQLQSGAIQIPPTCGLTGPTTICPTASSVQFSYQGTNAGNASLTFTFLTNTANATFASNGTYLGIIDATASSGGSYTLTVYPQTGGFTSGGDFQVNVVASTNDGSCTQSASMTHVEASSVAATASPTTVNMNAATYSSTLSALGTVDGVQDNSLFSSFTWSAVLELGYDDGSAGLSSTSGASVVFTPSFTGEYKFMVTAVTTEGCTSTATVVVHVVGGFNCPGFTGPQSVCAGSVSNTYTANGTLPDYTHYQWSVTGDATIESGVTYDVLSIQVTAGTGTFTVVLTASFDNTALTPITCTYTVTVTDCDARGCTLGFWKTHPAIWDQWTDALVVAMPGTFSFTTSTKFKGYFGNPSIQGINNNTTMLDVLNMQGGNCVALARNAIAALLSKAAFNEDYRFPGTFEQIRSLIIATFAGSSTYTCSTLNTALNTANNNEFSGACSALGDPGASFKGKIVSLLKDEFIPNKLTVTAAPNPFFDRVRFVITTPEEGHAQLDVMNLLGQKVATVFNEYMKANSQQIVEYNVPASAPQTMLYVLRIGNRQVTGKLLKVNQ